MTIDEIELGRCMCLCGKGQFIAIEHIKENSWGPDRVSHQVEVTCEECDAKYYVVAQGGITVRTRADLADRQQKSEIARQKNQEIRASRQVKELEARVQDECDKLPSAVAKHSFLSGMSLFHGGIAKFRSIIKQSGPYQVQIEPYFVRRVMQEMRFESPELEVQLAELDNLEDMAKEPVEPVASHLIG